MGTLLLHNPLIKLYLVYLGALILAFLFVPQRSRRKRKADQRPGRRQDISAIPRARRPSAVKHPSGPTSQGMAAGDGSRKIHWHALKKGLSLSETSVGRLKRVDPDKVIRYKRR
jgi:hypothetical protein